ncbi:hypothetical protein GOP47_0009758 [Adiantum capillus-veneris]|uniref:Uncharacterized protein n=1 Tax=Adiantum capillus-veneris TaxID=13818 RepID=A0A9D4ZJ04_ADICA|nr:hypothetical protein GOP47_0009758 [Adiantum capillus-veneris]
MGVIGKVSWELWKKDGNCEGETGSEGDESSRGGAPSVCGVMEVAAVGMDDVGDGVNSEEMGVRGGAGVLPIGCA